MALGRFRVYLLSTIRASVPNEGLWTNREPESVYFLNRYLDTKDQQHQEKFEQALASPIAYRQARELLETAKPDLSVVRFILLRAGATAPDVSSLIWMFRNCRGFYYLEVSIAKWKETDPYILELQKLGASVGSTRQTETVAALKSHLEQIETEITPRAIAFSDALDNGARVVENLLSLANLAFACGLAGLTIWRVGRVLRQRRQIENALVWQASHDELTGLFNRRDLDERLSRFAKTRKFNATCTLMFIDLDQFKIVNDTCGHAAGDALLRRIGPELQHLLGPNDLLARFGGDEFCIFMPASDKAHGVAIAEEVRAAIEKMDFCSDGRSFGVTASIGLVHGEVGAMSPKDMMSQADMACFMAKEKGRNRVHSHRDEDQDLLVRRREMNWVQRIHHALAEDRFCLYAQEIVPLARVNARGIHVELLLRLRDENGVLIPPSSFLPAAERFGLMKIIDLWVVRRAFKTLAERRALNIATPITCCAINLSGASIGDGSFLAFLREAFAEFGIEPETICFEVTETIAIVNLKAARDFVRELRKLGCTFALDDFGSGMSSFKYLKELPVDYLKIDGSFVKNLLLERPDRAMVEMICHVGHVMGKMIVAEFVETEALAEALRDIGVDFGQGFGIAFPKPFDADFIGLTRGEPQSTQAYERMRA